MLETHHKIRTESSRRLEGKGIQGRVHFAHTRHGHHSYSSKHHLEIVRWYHSTRGHSCSNLSPSGSMHLPEVSCIARRCDAISTYHLSRACFHCKSSRHLLQLGIKCRWGLGQGRMVHSQLLLSSQSNHSIHCSYQYSTKQ